MYAYTVIFYDVMPISRLGYTTLVWERVQEDRVRVNATMVCWVGLVCAIYITSSKVHIYKLFLYLGEDVFEAGVCVTVRDGHQ